MRCKVKKFLGKSITFDDVLLIPQYSNILPKDVNLTTNLTKNIRLNIPIVSACMDTVTESELAIALAREGGIGIIHKNMSIDLQAREVYKVKQSDHYIIYNPITLQKNSSIRDLKHLLMKYKITSVPIVDNEKKLLGIATSRNVRYELNKNKKVCEIMQKQQDCITTRLESLQYAQEILKKNKLEILPIVNDEFILQGIVTNKDTEKKFYSPNAVTDQTGKLLVGASIGITNDMFDRIIQLNEVNVDVLVIDTAHGYSSKVLNAIEKIKGTFSNIQLIVGNIATASAAKALISAGADAIKVGIGPGAICTTRVITGVGIPQVTAIYNCAKVALKYNIPLIADGGMKYSGDLAKALAAGADTCMIGFLLAGTDESASKTLFYKNKPFKAYRGMGSRAAMLSGSRDRYFQDENEQQQNKSSKLVAEGVEGCVPCKGKLSDVIYQLVGGIKASMGYCGVNTIKKFQEKSQFVEITSSGLIENHPHNIFITKDELNYSK
ncbi:MAG: IMP dehydrogenase [Endomicrobium sp.]|jgi:IMP dehydrogenase|nr:IMP dehydrogenase [Endomicrobium sp.]